MQQTERITVIGAGTMGHGIAQVAAQAGYTITLYDITVELAEAGLERVRANLDKGIERGKVTAEQRAAALSRLASSGDLPIAVDQADLIIEAVLEKLELKHEVFKTVSSHAPSGAVLATNTSSLSVASIAQAVSRPDRLIGMHFFNPVHIMELLEIVVHDRTSPQTLETARAVGAAMGKTAIVVRDSPGFATSRLGIALGLEAMRMLESGVASAEDIDTAMELGYRHPMGPLELTDLVGLDVRLEIAEYLHDKLDGRGKSGNARFEPPEILRDLVAEGNLGKKSGRGFYDWPES